MILRPARADFTRSERRRPALAPVDWDDVETFA
jgi:hypothetical protein